MASKSGYNATLTVSGYTGAELTNVTASINSEPIDVSDLASVFRERANGLLDWEVSGTKNYVTQAFLTLALSGATSVGVAVTDSAATGVVIFSGAAYVTRGLTTLPMGAATEEITVVGTGATPVVASG